MSHLLKLIIIGILYRVITTEWIEIIQKPNSTKSSMKIRKKSSSNILYTEVEDATTPSPQWIEYQRERFSEKQNFNSQKLIISATKHLKNSAQIVVPASNVQDNSKFTQRNQVFKTKTRLDVVKNKVDFKIETTSRRDMNYKGDVDDGDDDTGVEHDQQQIEEEDAEETVEEQVEEDADDAINEDNQPTPSTEENSESGLQFPSVQGFLKFIKSMQKTWLKKSAFGIEQKIKLLKKLKDSLMSTIERQFTMLWQPKERQRRSKRGLLDESNLNFPPEAALMSINFLTFAVFLIKLVLQVVHIIKSKHYSFSTMGVTADPLLKSAIKT